MRISGKNREKLALWGKKKGNAIDVLNQKPGI